MRKFIMECLVQHFTVDQMRGPLCARAGIVGDIDTLSNARDVVAHALVALAERENKVNALKQAMCTYSGVGPAVVKCLAAPRSRSVPPESAPAVSLSREPAVLPSPPPANPPMQSIGGMDTVSLRSRLQQLDDVALDALCLDHFGPVYDKFNAGMRKDQKANLLLDYCRRNPGQGERLIWLLEEGHYSG